MWSEAQKQTQEFANGLVGLAEVAYQWSKDGQPPKADLLPGQGKYAGPVRLRFETSEPATVRWFATDAAGNRSTLKSAKIEIGG